MADDDNAVLIEARPDAAPDAALDAGPAVPDAAPGTEADGPARRSWLRRPLALVALLLVLALVAATVTLLVAVLGARQHDALRAEAVDTARDYAVALSSFDFENLDANRDAITAQSTPAFAEKYGQMVDALRQIVTDGKGTAIATATHVGVESVDEQRAVVLAFVDQQATNVVSPGGNTQKYRMVVTLVRDGDRWLVDNVDTN